MILTVWWSYAIRVRGCYRELNYSYQTLCVAQVTSFEVLNISREKCSYKKYSYVTSEKCSKGQNFLTSFHSKERKILKIHIKTICIRFVKTDKYQNKDYMNVKASWDGKADKSETNFIHTSCCKWSNKKHVKFLQFPIDLYDGSEIYGWLTPLY